MLAVTKLQAGYGAAQVLFDISFEVGAGEVVALLGRNGMGKTTTVKTVMGLLPPRGGEVRLDGAVVSGLPPYRVAKHGIGLVPEAPQIFPTLTDREREILNLIAQGHPNPSIARQLSLSTKTVGNYVSNIFTKLQVADRAQAIIRAREAGLG